ncbi:Not1 N-terminal domain, CCR4-Not complex component-domain-containing protein [Daedaleopsis nitida]|nr:Not1 N-terminal domain, CCR4-Not complex component-domain-containing protein [Daedaleopsis nitida]
MAARKLQTEIDRTLKKVAEGVEVFESIYDKMQASTNQTQKEKLETDLKTQIKKLQRLRDQIKTWVASNDIKDKSALLDNRKLIETQMEKFKACEKEMKTKAFSKEGLTQSAKLDPKQQEKVDTMSWVQQMMDELMVQVESAEAEIETLQGGGKKKNKSGGTAERLEALERLNERRKWHISRLEIILRLLDNGSLSTDKVVSLQEDVKFFVESNMDEDFEEYEGVYDDLNLDEEEEKFRMPIDESESEDSEEASEDLPLRTPSKKHDEESVASSNKRDSPVLKKAATTLQHRIRGKYGQDTSTTTKSSVRICKGCSCGSCTLNIATITGICVVTSKHCASNTIGVYDRLNTIGGPATTSSPQRPAARKASLSSPTLQPPGVSHPAQQEPATSASQTNGLLALSQATVQASTPSPLPQQAQPFSSASTTIAPGPSANTSPMPPPAQQQPRFPPGVSLSSTEPTKLSAGTIGVRPPSATPSQLPGQIQQRATAFPGSLSDLVMSFENVKQKAPHRMSNLDQVHKLLQGSYSSMPQPQDTEKPKYYVPRNPIQTPSYYPQMPHPLLNTPGIFAQLDVETLFYVFYYHPGTYQQYLAAKELKRQSWRFHVKYLTWFQRHSEPQAITEEYEQGVYVYFDWEGSWCQRKKSDFRFEYRYLSED